MESSGVLLATAVHRMLQCVLWGLCCHFVYNSAPLELSGVLMKISISCKTHNKYCVCLDLSKEPFKGRDNKDKQEVSGENHNLN